MPMIRKLIMSIFSVVIFYCMILASIKQISSNTQFENYVTVLEKMQESLQFIQDKQIDKHSAIVYSTEMKSFYEWTDWKRIKESKYINQREGDFGIIRSYALSSYFIDSDLGFNSYLNNFIPLDRVLSDFRPNLCKHWHYLPQALPNVSVIISLVDEDISIMLRSIYSILLNTPRNLLNEIILIVDNPNSQHYKNDFLQAIQDHMKFNFEVDNILWREFLNYSNHMPLRFEEKFDFKKIRLFVTPKRSGLGNSLNFAIRKTTGKVLVFLKSYVEVTANWLPPLLAPILDDPNTVSIPNFIEVDPSSFKYDNFENGNLELVFWNWGLFTKATNISLVQSSDQYDYLQTLPYKLSLVTSSQFAISKEFFQKIGFFDQNYLIFSETNMDLSLKILHCAGRILKIPCSQVFVLQKTIPDRLMELFDELFIENDFRFHSICFLKTMAKKWIAPMNISNFYTMHPSLYGDFCQNTSNGYEVSDLTMLTNQCSNSDSVLLSLSNQSTAYSIVTENVLPVIKVNTVYISTSPPENLFWGGIMNVHYSICLNVETSRRSASLKVECAYCHNKPTATVFRLDIAGVLRIEDYCLYPSEGELKVGTFSMMAINCFFDNQNNKNLVWQYTPEGQFRFNSKYCLTFDDSQGAVLAPCLQLLAASQIWLWNNYH